jgi:hypothetical protein
MFLNQTVLFYRWFGFAFGMFPPLPEVFATIGCELKPFTCISCLWLSAVGIGWHAGCGIAMATGFQRDGRFYGNCLLMSDGCRMGENSVSGGALVLPCLFAEH